MLIDSIFAAEFDLIKGCIIKGSYPLEYSEECYFASAMIPDGVHKVTRDKFYFKLGAPQIKEGQVRVYHFEKGWQILFKQDYQQLKYIDGKTIKITTNNPNEWLDINLINSRIDRVAKDFVVIQVNPHLKYGIQGEILEEFYLAVLRNKKDQNIKRGSLIRSVAVRSQQNLYLGIIDQFLEQALDKYMNTIGVEHWNQQEMVQVNHDKLHLILEETFKIVNGCSKLQYYNFSDTLLDWNFKDFPNYYEKKLEGLSQQASLIDLIQIFKMKIRIIYRAILQQKRIMFLSHECNNQHNIFMDEIYCRSCNLLVSLQFLVYPLNIQQHLQGYKSLMDPLWDSKNSWITVVSNPIFEYRKEWWDVFCDIHTQKVIESKQSDHSLFIHNEQDIDFFQSLINLINDQHITESQVRTLLWKYTIMVMKNEKLKQIRDHDDCEKMILKKVFTEKQINQLTKSIELLQQDRDLDDLELLSFYLSVTNHIKTEEQFKLFIKIFLQKGCTMNLFGIGLLCTDSQVRTKCRESLKLIEKYDKSLMRKLSVMMII